MVRFILGQVKIFDNNVFCLWEQSLDANIAPSWY